MSQTDSQNVYESVLSQIDALIYRCRNDENYTMDFLEGHVREITGYSKNDILGNNVVSWMGITCQDDIDRITATVDAAIEADKPWDVDYRVVRENGELAWVRERGSAVHEDGKLLFLQGLIVGAEAEVELRKTAEQAAERHQKEGREIMQLATDIMNSVDKLSMLAVNARIEAARSGPAGLGFAVVAEEMSNLANENGAIAQKLTERLQHDDKAKKVA